MTHLINLELKKFFYNKNNYILILVFSLFLAGFIYMNHQKNLGAAFNLSEDINYNLQLNQSNLPKLQSDYQQMPDNKQLMKVIETTQQDIQFLTQMRTAIVLGDWSLYLENKIQYDQQTLVGIESGLISSSLNPKQLEDDISLNTILLEDGIQPIFTENSMLSLNFITVFLGSSLVLILLLIVIFFSSGIIPNDFEKETYKYIYTQPISKAKIFLSKLFSALLINYIWIFIILGTSFISLTAIFGIGDINYPFKLMMTNETTYISIGSFCFIGLLLLFFIITLTTIITVFISTLIHSTSGALVISMLLTLALSLGSDQATSIAHLNPFAYYNITNLLNGTLVDTFENVNLTVNTAYFLFPSFILIFFLVALFSFKKMKIQ